MRGTAGSGAETGSRRRSSTMYPPVRDRVRETFSVWSDFDFDPDFRSPIIVNIHSYNYSVDSHCILYVVACFAYLIVNLMMHHCFSFSPLDVAGSNSIWCSANLDHLWIRLPSQFIGAKGYQGRGGQTRVRHAWSCPNLSKLVQTCPDLSEHFQSCRNLRDCVDTMVRKSRAYSENRITDPYYLSPHTSSLSFMPMALRSSRANTPSGRDSSPFR